MIGSLRITARVAVCLLTVIAMTLCASVASANGGAIVQRQRIVTRTPFVQRQRLVVRQQIVQPVVVQQVQAVYAQQQVVQYQQQIVQRVVNVPVYQQQIVQRVVAQPYYAPQAFTQQFNSGCSSGGGAGVLQFNAGGGCSSLFGR